MTGTSKVEIIDRAAALRLLPKRDQHAHKWGVGGLLIVGGAPGYIGAPALAAQGAGRSGAGIVNLAIPRSSVGPTATLVPEAVFLPLPETDSTHGVKNAIDLIAPVAEKCRALVVGPGLSRDDAASALLAALFGDTRRSVTHALGFGSSSRANDAEGHAALVGKNTPAVVDADALHWLAERDSWWTQVEPFSLLLTPHVGEFAALTGTSNEEILADPATVVRAAANDWRQVLVLKAGKSWISDGNVVRGLDCATPALATAGTGDVLAGSIGAFLAQGLLPLDAATLAIYAGSQAAVRLTAELSSLGVVAGDLPRAIATILADLETESDASR
ncbi:MAG TPA: NAD(P)H-hydrate dehydratase [Thermomicrobiales bacterium]|nr:NAD(P)H-hydrate dehydratase [Thermomicrobiales bacterium]